MFKKTIFGLSIFFCIAMILGSTLGGQTQSEEVARVVAVKGDVKVVPKDTNVGKVCVSDMILHQGDWVKTGQNAVVSIAFDENMDNVIRVEENSIVIIKLDGYFKIQLLTGELYAMLEDVKSNDSFKILTPSVLTEAMSSGWGVKSDGTYTNVVVFDNKVFICGLNKDGTVKEDKFWIKEGYQRKTIKFEDPGELERAPEDLVDWFKEQVLAHHLERTLAKQRRSTGKSSSRTVKAGAVLEQKGTATVGGQERSTHGGRAAGNTIIVDGKEVNLLDYLYNKRLEKSKEAKNMLKVDG